MQQSPVLVYCDEDDRAASSCPASDETLCSSVAKKCIDTRADSPIESIETQTPAHRKFGVAVSCMTDEDDKELTHHHYDHYLGVSDLRRTSVSSLPSSEDGTTCYTPAKGPRSSLHSPNTKRIYGTSSPHRIFRASSPRKSVNVRASPRPRTRERQGEKDQEIYPLVLLHVTLLPVVLPWSQVVAKEALPKTVKDDLALLRSRMSGVVLQRGILVPHPQEEFHTLEEKVLEALDLAPLNRDSCRCDSESVEYDRYSSVSEVISEAQETCQTCGEESCFAQRLQKRWEIRVYAANGLMRAGAWEAAWSEMERVDVELLPYIAPALKARLDELQEDRDQVRVSSSESNVATSELSEDEQLKKTSPSSSASAELPPVQPNTHTSQQAPSEACKPVHPIPKDDSLPAVYKTKDIPLRVLLANYIYLLAQDRRNIAILFLLLTIVFSTVQGMGAQRSATSGITYSGHSNESNARILVADGIGQWSVSNGSTQAMNGLSESVGVEMDNGTDTDDSEANNVLAAVNPIDRGSRHVKDTELGEEKDSTVFAATTAGGDNVLDYLDWRKCKESDSGTCRPEPSVLEMVCMAGF